MVYEFVDRIKAAGFSTKHDYTSGMLLHRQGFFERLFHTHEEVSVGFAGPHYSVTYRLQEPFALTILKAIPKLVIPGISAFYEPNEILYSVRASYRNGVFAGGNQSELEQKLFGGNHDKH